MAKNKDKKPGFFSQIKNIYLFTQARMKLLPLLLILEFLFVGAVGTLSIIFFGAWMFLPIVVVLAVFIPLITMAQVGNHLGMKEIEGKPGAAGAILVSVKNKGLSFSEEPVAVNQKTKELVFRGVGRPGIVFVSEGESGKVNQMLAKERQKARRYAPNVPIYTIQSGNKNGQIPMKKLRKEIKKFKNTLTKTEVEQLRKRLSAVGVFRPPIPKGFDPMNKSALKGSRKALRG